VAHPIMAQFSKLTSWPDDTLPELMMAAFPVVVAAFRTIPHLAEIGPVLLIAASPVAVRAHTLTPPLRAVMVAELVKEASPDPFCTWTLTPFPAMVPELLKIAVPLELHSVM